jgi:hypothetical protein
MSDWTIEDVAARFAEAADTARRLPRVQVQGYFNVWPVFARDAWDAYPDDHSYRPLPPSPQAIDRMMEVMRWVQWLEVEQRHLVWMRAKHYEWHQIGRRLGCDRTTAWRHWKRAMEILVAHLEVVTASCGKSCVKAEC